MVSSDSAPAKRASAARTRPVVGSWVAGSALLLCRPAGSLFEILTLLYFNGISFCCPRFEPLLSLGLAVRPWSVAVAVARRPPVA